MSGGWVGFRPVGPDDLPLLGPVSGVGGLVVATGLGPSGLPDHGPLRGSTGRPDRARRGARHRPRPPEPAALGAASRMTQVRCGPLTVGTGPRPGRRPVRASAHVTGAPDYHLLFWRDL